MVTEKKYTKRDMEIMFILGLLNAELDVADIHRITKRINEQNVVDKAISFVEDLRSDNS